MSYVDVVYQTVSGVLSAGGTLAFQGPDGKAGRIDHFTFAVATATGANDRLNIGTTLGTENANFAPGVVTTGNVIVADLKATNLTPDTKATIGLAAAGTGVGTLSATIAWF